MLSSRLAFVCLLSLFLTVSVGANETEKVPPPKLETPEYLEARKQLLENLLPEYHAPALRVWHRMIDFMSSYYSLGRTSRNRPEIIKYSFGRNEKGESFLLLDSYRGSTAGELELFRIVDKHIVGVDFCFLTYCSCPCCAVSNYPEFDKELLADIAKFKKVSNFHASGTTVDIEALAELEGTEHITGLSLYDVELDEPAFRSLGRLKNLESLAIGHAFSHSLKFDFFDISRINLLAPLQNLRVLRINSRVSTLRAFPHLAGLEEFYLEIDAISDEALEQIKALPNIKKVHVHRGYRGINGRSVLDTIFQWEKSDE